MPNPANNDPCALPQLRSVDDCLFALLEAANPPTKHETVALEDAAGRVLAEPIDSPIAVPGHDNSAMDGYAVRREELADLPARLRVSQRIPAGQLGQALAQGECARIFTGAPIPDNADAVVMQEQVERDGEFALFKQCPAPSENIRPKGNDIEKGSLVLEAGDRLDPMRLGLAASVGIKQLHVYPRLKVGVFCTGDELIEPGQALPEGAIYNSNQYLLSCLLESLGCEVENLGLIADNYASTQAALQQASANNDVIISSGGVSVGEEDHVKPAVESLGRLDLWRIAIKPGKPFAFGQIGDAAFLGLPGNPVSVLVTSLILARPYLLKRQGRNAVLPVAYPVSLGFDWTAHPRREFLRVRLVPNGQGGLKAQPYARQGSDVLSSAVWADGLVELEEHRAYQQGETANYYAFEQLLS